MPKITLRNENKITRAVREEIVVNPMISVSALRKNLQERGIMTYNGNPIDPVYLSRLVRKINRRAAKEADNVKIERRLSETRERFSVMIDRLMKIAFWRAEYIKENIWPPQANDVVKALDTIQKMDLALLQAEMDAGIYKRHLGTLDVEAVRRQPIPDDVREAAWRVFKNYGIIEENGKMPKIENEAEHSNEKSLAVIQQHP